ncbi:MAG: DUF2892 domain-containing protein [Persephonella sp.]|nr:DUF2892 domain-containing protein [Persephonella sp.]
MSKSAIRAQRFMMGTLLLIAMVLLSIGQDGENILFTLSYSCFIFPAFTGFCPSDAVFEKLFGKKAD